MKRALTQTTAGFLLAYAFLYAMVIGMSGIYASAETCNRACVEAHAVLNHPAIGLLTVAALACCLVGTYLMVAGHYMHPSRRRIGGRS